MVNFNGYNVMLAGLKGDKGEDGRGLNGDKKFGIFVTGENTLADEIVSFDIETRNLFHRIATPDRASAAETDTFSNSVVVSAIDDTSNFAYAAWKLNVTSGKVTAQASWTETGAGAKGAAYLYWNENNNFTKVAGQLDYSGRTVTIDVIPPSEGAELYLILYARINSPTPTAGDYVTYTNVQVERGETDASEYTAYINDGVEVQVVACGKNLFNTLYVFQTGSATAEINGDEITVTATAAQNYPYVAFNIGDFENGTTLTLSSEIEAVGESEPAIRIWWRTNNTFENANQVGTLRSTDDKFTFVVDKPENSQGLYLLLTANISGSASVIGAGGKFTNTQVEIGGNVTSYEPYDGQMYMAQVGSPVEIKQRDKITNVIAFNEGFPAAFIVDGEFMLSTRYELDDKLTPLFGTFANRPTDTKAYARMYIATDQTGENKVTILPANADGSVSNNWISI